MNPILIEHFSTISTEEKNILEGGKDIDRSIYMPDDSNQIDCQRLLAKGKLITLRPNTRFVHFPKHTHNYVEMVYMCKGSTRHRINGSDLTLHTGELLLLSKNAQQEVFPAGEDDIAVNFIILPQFFDTTLQILGEEENQIRDFLIGCLKGHEEGTGYLHFKVAKILPIQNLIENLIWIMLDETANKRSNSKWTMGLLFLNLLNHTETLYTDPRFESQQVMLQVLYYIEEHYREGELREVASLLHYNESWLSREIKKQSGKTFKELLQNKRLGQAAFLLHTTSLKVSDIGASVGYENLSYFHKIFQQKYGVSPHKYRCK